MTGWIHHRHKLNRPLTDAETSGRLDRLQRSPVLPDERVNLLRMNSTYADFIDSHFMDRGYPTLGGIIFVPLSLCLPLGTYPLIERWGAAEASAIEISIVFFFGVLCLAMALAVWRWTVKRDIRTYTHFPVRFNRKTRIVYVFRHNGPDGVLSVPWEKAFFFIGGGQGAEKHLFELRCHVLDESGLVTETFALGHDDTSRGGIMEVWEMIRLYMEEGPQAVPQYPVCLFPEKVEWKESRRIMSTRIGGANLPMMIVTSPFWGVASLMHYLVMKTCKAPVWPKEIEEACRVEPDDPHVLAEELYGSGHPRAREVWDAVGERRDRNREVLQNWERQERLSRLRSQ